MVGWFLFSPNLYSPMFCIHLESHIRACGQGMKTDHQFMGDITLQKLVDTERHNSLVSVICLTINHTRVLASLVAQMVKILPAMQEWKWKWKLLSCVWLFETPWTIIPWKSPGQNTRVGSLSLFQGIFPTQWSNPGLPNCRWILYQLSHKADIIGLIPGLGKSPGIEHGNPFQNSCLENPHGERALRAKIHGVTKNQTQLSD